MATFIKVQPPSIASYIKAHYPEIEWNIDTGLNSALSVRMNDRYTVSTFDFDSPLYIQAELVDSMVKRLRDDLARRELSNDR